MSSNMFGIVVIGRMVETNFQQVGERQFLTVIPDADNVNHLAVFLTGQVPFPPGTAGLIYFSYPDPNAPPNWQLLGVISNEKPSCVFKISGLKQKEEQSGFLQFGQQAISHNAQIGISVESLDLVQQQMSLLETNKPNEASNFLEFTRKMVENFASYITPFSRLQGTTYVVPLTVLQNWYQNFERRLEMNPYFWRS